MFHEAQESNTVGQAPETECKKPRPYLVFPTASGKITVFTCATTGCHYTTSEPKKMVSHVKDNHGPTFACDVCGKLFSRSTIVQRHKISAHDKMRVPFICEYCGKGFSRRDGLSAHAKIKSLPFSRFTDTIP